MCWSSVRCRVRKPEREGVCRTPDTLAPSEHPLDAASNRPGPPVDRTNDLFAPQCSGLDHNGNSISSINGLGLDSLSGLVARLILHNYLPRLGDTGCHGGALWGCLPSPPPPAPHCHGAAPASNRCQAPCVHTCPSATQPYVATNNVFVIPANLVHQQPHLGGPGTAGVGTLNNFNAFLGDLGLGSGGINSGCAGGLNLAHGFNAHSSGVGLGAQINLGRFSCPSCNGHL